MDLIVDKINEITDDYYTDCITKIDHNMKRGMSKTFYQLPNHDSRCRLWDAEVACLSIIKKLSEMDYKLLYLGNLQIEILHDIKHILEKKKKKAHELLNHEYAKYLFSKKK